MSNAARHRTEFPTIRWSGSKSKSNTRSSASISPSDRGSIRIQFASASLNGLINPDSSNTGSMPSLVYLAVSRDGGITWPPDPMPPLTCGGGWQQISDTGYGFFNIPEGGGAFNVTLRFTTNANEKLLFKSRAKASAATTATLSGWGTMGGATVLLHSP